MFSLSVGSDLAIVEDEVADGSSEQLIRPVFALRLPRPVVLRLLPTPVKLIDLLL